MSLKNFFSVKCRKWLLMIFIILFIFLIYETNSPWMSPNKFLRNTYISDARVTAENGKISSMSDVKIKIPDAKIVLTIKDDEDENSTLYKKHTTIKQETYTFGIFLEQLELDEKDAMFFARNYIIGQKIPITSITIEADIKSANLPRDALRTAQRELIEFKKDFKKDFKTVTKPEYECLDYFLKQLGLNQHQRAFLFFRFLKIPAKIKAKPTSYSYAVKNSDMFGKVLIIYIKAEIVSIKCVEPK